MKNVGLALALVLFAAPAWASAPTCPQGSTLGHAGFAGREAMCLVDGACPPGTSQYEGSQPGVCQTVMNCPPGFTFVGGKPACQARPSCPKAQGEQAMMAEMGLMSWAPSTPPDKLCP